MNERVERYLEHLPAIIASVDAQECPFFFHNSLFLVSRLAHALDWGVEKVDGGLLINAASDWCVVLPTTTDRDAYAAAVLGALVPGRPLLRAPAWLALRPEVLAHFEVRRLWHDFVCRTDEMQSMKGGRLKSVRQRIQRVEATGKAEVIALGAGHEAEAAELARLWYRQRSDALGTMYLYEENVWLFGHWSWVTRAIPGAFGVGVLYDGRLVAANLSSPLSATFWVCHTERYDPAAPVYSNQLAFREACRLVDADQRPFVNDGPAEAFYRPGVDDLASFKHRLAAMELQPYRLLRRR